MTTCTHCHAPDPTGSTLCVHCTATLTRQLQQLPRMYEALGILLAPSMATGQGRGGKGGPAPLPVDGDTFDLRASFDTVYAWLKAVHDDRHLRGPDWSETASHGSTRPSRGCWPTCRGSSPPGPGLVTSPARSASCTARPPPSSTPTPDPAAAHRPLPEHRHLGSGLWRCPPAGPG
ncbi:hypothetical protein [Streptomyces microflavus]|uniref:hypothetical protein n=1 Tax=Streptomyces microflavus TaxID=1919 RepID=UPI003B2267DC